MWKATAGEVSLECFIHSDNSKQFVSQVFAESLTQYGIRHVITGFYAPQSNSAERVNLFELQMLRVTTENGQRLWDSHLSRIA